MQGRIRNNEYRTTIVCIDSYENSVPSGRFFNPYNEEWMTEGELMWLFCTENLS